MRLIRDSVYIFSFTRHETNPSQSARWRGRVERNRKRERERGKGMGVGQGTRGGAKDVKQDARVEKRGGEGSEKLRTSCDGNKSSVLPCTSFRVRCTRIYPLQPPSTLYHVARTRHSSRPKWNFVLAPRSVDARICVSNVVFHPSLAIHPLRYPSISLRLPGIRYEVGGKCVALFLSANLDDYFSVTDSYHHIFAEDVDRVSSRTLNVVFRCLGWRFRMWSMRVRWGLALCRIGVEYLDVMIFNPLGIAELSNWGYNRG